MIESIGTVVAQAPNLETILETHRDPDAPPPRSRAIRDKQGKFYLQFWKFYPAPFYCEELLRSKKVRG